MRIEQQLMRGAGPVAILKLLHGGEMYGYELIKALDDQSEGVLAMGQSSLYPLLYNLEAKGLIEGFWREADSGRDRKYYRLTDAGKKRLADDIKQWRALAVAMKGLGVLPASSVESLAGGAS
ncbi:MAG TPA: helix-turn-helix transcriptional regulator [Phycisphaerales bacterium]|nr:helix-turn-helix transcriptional regulator [Phycisphaerales bacterium]